jgi:diguanylate cyclase (GGDEF)-like protein
VPETIKILLVEDSERDADLILAELKRAGLKFAGRRVQARTDLERELLEFCPHIVLSDYAMPRFSGLKALAVCKETDPDLPFIFVSGTIGEEVAAQALTSGGSDYVMKSNLIRLASAVKREVAEATVRRGRRVAEAGLRRAQLLAKLGHIITTPDGSFESWSETLPDIIGVDPKNMPRSTRDWLKLLHPEDVSVFRRIAIEAAAAKVRSYVTYRVLFRPAEQWIHIRQVMEPIGSPDAAGRFSWFNTLQDITEQTRAEERIRRLNRVYAVLSGINSAIVRIRDYQDLLDEACRICVQLGEFEMAWIGIIDRDAKRLIPRAQAGDAQEFLASVPPEAMSTAEGDGAIARAMRTRQPTIEHDVRNASALVMHDALVKRGINSLAVVPLVMDGTARGALALYAKELHFFDDEEMRLLLELAGDIAFAIHHIDQAKKLEHAVYYDALTGLPNRTLFLERLARYLATADHEKARFALLLIDVVRFRAVNEALGRNGGDALLREIAARMRAYERDEARLARIANDHFAFAVPEFATEQELGRRTERKFLQIFGEPFHTEREDLRLSVRAGIALYPNDGADPDSLFRSAEVALKKAKEQGERYVFYQGAMSERVAEKLALESKLRQALEKEQFVLHYQPKVDLQTRSIVGAEALIRWQSDEGLVPPAHFVPLLEETGLILQVGSWALRRASLDHRALTEQGLRPPRVAVNVSQIQLRQRDFVEMVEQAIMVGLAPAGIDLEITETLLMENVQGNIQKLKSVRELGISIAVDDFGTGYSSLGYLTRLPVQALKIDHSFITTMHEDPNAMTLVSTIISLAHSLRLKVIAEGVETEEQATMLRLLRCDEMQGYLFSKPVPIGQLAQLLTKN